MKNTKIFPKDWLQLHPYKQSGPTDLYYTRIANQIHEMMEQTDLANSFEKEDVIQISMRMAAYFEDVISGLNIWRAFITEYKKQTGNYLPFYTVSDHYYDDEANYEDVRFLLWHYTQQYHGAKKGTFVNPDNPANEETARLIYQLFCKEWTTAPENTKMQALFAPETSYEDPEKQAELLHWFHYNSYLLTDSNVDLSETVKEYWRQNPNDRQNTQAVMVIYDSLAHISRTPLLAYTYRNGSRLSCRKRIRTMPPSPIKRKKQNPLSTPPSRNGKKATRLSTINSQKSRTASYYSI